MRMAEEHSFDLVGEKRAIWLPSWDGSGEVPTSFSYSLFHRFFCTHSERLVENKSPLRLYNCTEGGAFIDGMEHIPLAEAVRRHAADWDGVDVGAAIDRVSERMDPPARALKVGRRVRAMRIAMERCVGVARKCEALAERAAFQPRLIPELDKLEAELGAALKPVLFISLLKQRDIGDAVRDGKRASTAASSLEISRRLYGIILEAGALLGPVLNRIEADLLAGGM